jgi:hypothetical protein
MRTYCKNSQKNDQKKADKILSSHDMDPGWMPSD